MDAWGGRRGRRMGTLGVLLGLLVAVPASAANLYAHDEDDLNAELAIAGSGDTIFITASFDVGDAVVLSEGVEVDGDGFTLTSTGNHPVFRAQAPVTLRDLVLHSTHNSGQLVHITADGAGSLITGVRVCGLSAGATMVRMDAATTMENSVFEGVSGDVLGMADGSITHVTVLGGTVSLAGTVMVDASAMTSSPGAAVVTNSVVGPSVPDVVAGANPLCPSADARPAPLGNLWDAGGMHLGGYQGGIDEPGTPFVAWNDVDGDGAPYGPDGGGADDWDCDDEDAAIGPDSAELCDAIDNDCDGETDEDPEPKTAGAFQGFVDGDGDLVGSEEVCWVCNDLSLDDTCVPASGDCDDNDRDKTDPEDCDPPDTGTPPTGDDDDDVPGDDDDDVVPGDDDDDDAPTDGTLDDTGDGLVGKASDGCQCASAVGGWAPWSWARRR